MRITSAAAILLASSHSCQSLSTVRPCTHVSRPATACRYANDEFNDGLNNVIKRRRPKRSMPHIHTASRAEEATRAGYIISQNFVRQNHVGDDISVREQADGDERRVRPLRVIRRIVLRRGGRRNRLTSASAPASTVTSMHEDSFGCDELTEEVTVNVRYSSPNKNPPSLNSEKTVPNRVTFKSSRQASHSLQNFGFLSASLTEYMTQPVEQYSLLSFHDEESDDNVNPAARRWLVRRLSAKESQRYMNKQEAPDNADNLFRLAVPLLPLIGWDLTPVIDLEVIPPNVSYDSSEIVDARHTEADDHEIRQSKWAPLKGIRDRVQGNDAVVKIRSLRVSLLSTQEEVHAAMNGKQPNTARRQNSSLKMQEEALSMVGKVEEWLKPQITFEAEISWNDAFADTGTMSTVTAKATAITSLTIPSIPSGILRAAVPSAFLIKRLGATLTSKALEICLPRFLRQLDRDYKRWSGVDQESSGKIIREKSHV